MAVATTSNSDLVTNLDQKMAEMPLDMVRFSAGLRALHNEYGICNDASAAKFRQVREAVRKDAIVYASTVMPYAQAVVANISDYFDNYCGLSYEDWQESLEDIIEEVGGYESECKLLIQLHEDLMTSLKKREDEATVSVKELGELTASLKAQVKKCEEEAARRKVASDNWAFWGAILAPVTLGASLAVTVAPAIINGVESGKQSAEAVAAQKNVDITSVAVLMTQEMLIPSIKSFISALSACAQFFGTTEMELKNMSRKAKITLDKKESEQIMSRHFKLMKNNSQSIKQSCSNFYGAMVQVRSDLAAIPLENNDKNYVDRWLEEQKKKFEQAHQGRMAVKMWKTIDNGLKGYWSQRALK